jgi:hypothetical protein
LTGTDLIINLISTPSPGVNNFIPIYLYIQNSIIGLGVFQNWATSQALVPFVPFFSRQVNSIREGMKRPVMSMVGSVEGSSSPSNSVPNTALPGDKSQKSLEDRNKYLN